MTIEPDKLKGMSISRYSWDYKKNTLAEHWLMMGSA